MKIKARFYISEIDERDVFSKTRKNFECIINAAFMSGDYPSKSWAYQLLGDEHEKVVNYLSETIKNFRARTRYRIVRKVTKCMNVKELIFSYHYKNLKLEQVI